MRKKERIKPFLEEIGILWEKVPDWRFGQLIVNIMSTCKKDPWFYEDDEMLDLWKEYFKEEKEGVKIQNEKERESSGDSTTRI